MKQAEYLVENARQYVIVRVPKPKLSECALIDTEQVLCENVALFGNGAISEGEEIKNKANAEATLKIQEALASNEMYMENAENSAITLISNLVKNLNPNIPGLKVEVEFME